MNPSTRILLVEDDERLAGLIRQFLVSQGMSVSVVADGPAAVAAILASSPDCVILDMLLPGCDGIEVCRRVRPSYAGWILMLTAQDEEIDEVVALEAGVDDYLTKPVRPQRLLARLHALLRRSRGGPVGDPAAEPPQNLIAGAGLTIDGDRRCVQRRGSPVGLTDTEFDLLWLLASRAPEIVSRDDIMQGLRGIEHDGLDRSADMRVSKLRRKLGDEMPPHEIIKTVRGRGYLFLRS